MSVWRQADIYANSLDFQIARDGRPLVIKSDEHFAATARWLRDKGYRLVIFDANQWRSEADMHRALALALDFPDYYGNNLDALEECLGEVAEHEYGWEGNETGLVLVFTSMKPFGKVDKRAADTLLEIVTERCSYAALFGNRLLALVSPTPLRSGTLQRPF